MRIRDIFATEIQQRIEPVVKVADRRPGILLGELQNLVITPQWEQYLWRILDLYTDAADRENEQGIGIWVSGFFGSGKSLLMKTLGVLLEGGALDGRSVHETFLSRIPANSPQRADLQRFLTICQRKLATTSVGGNIHGQQANSDEPLSLIAFKLFAQKRGYTHHWPLAWAVACRRPDDPWSLYSLGVLREAEGSLAARRAQQQQDWMWAMVDAHLEDAVRAHPAVRGQRADLEAAVRAGQVSAVDAADRILRAFLP